MKPTALRHRLSGMTEGELRKLVLDFAGLRKENAEWLDAKLKGNEGLSETLNYYKERIRKAFRGQKIDLREAKRAISEFKKISREPEPLLDLMVFYVEEGERVERESGACTRHFTTALRPCLRKQLLSSTRIRDWSAGSSRGFSTS